MSLIVSKGSGGEGDGRAVPLETPFSVKISGVLPQEEKQ